MIIVLFDIDQTLLNAEFDDKCFIDAFKDIYDIDIRNANWNNYKHSTALGITIEIFKDHFNREPDLYEIENIKSRFIKRLKYSIESYKDNIYEIPGANEIIKELKNNDNYIIGFATGCWRASALLKLRGANIDFDGIEMAHSDNHISKKDILKNILNNIKKYNLRCNIDKIFYVADRKYDYEVTKELNIDFIGVDYNKDGDLKHLGIKKVVYDFKDKDIFMEYLKF